MNNPKILNLDDLETPESEIIIRHNGEDHAMRTLTVEGFIAQQKRARDAKAAEDANASGENQDIGQVVEVMSTAVTEFFPTLDVSTLPTAKLFKIFAWLNDLTAQMNAAAAPATEADASAEGNAPATETTPAS